MNSKRLNTIKVKIAGREYPMKVKDSESQRMEWIAREVDQKIKEFQIDYSNRDLQDCIVMTLLTYAVDYYQNDQSETDLQDPIVGEKLGKINSLLDSMLKS